MLFGGYWGLWLQQGTWEWDGVAWSLKQSLHAPAPRSSAEMCWDPNTGKVLLFGGKVKDKDGFAGAYLNDTWLWDGQDWEQVFPKHSPGPLSDFGLALDPLRRRVVLFGGAPAYQRVVNDTWEWDGSDWTLMSPKNRPAPKAGVGFAFNWYSRRLLLAGGGDWSIPGPPRDFWEWDGLDWHKLAAPAKPTFHGASAVTDPISNEVFLWAFKGEPDPGKSTMWRWGGQSWNPVSANLDEDGGVLAADVSRKRIHAIPPPPSLPPLRPRQSSWEYDGASWSQVWQKPWPKGVALGAYDSARQEFVVWVEPTPLESEIWLYRLMDNGWRKPSTPLTMPSKRTRPHLVGLGRNGPVVLFGGFKDRWLFADEVFVWTGSDWSKRTYPTYPGSSGTVTVDTQRQVVIYYNSAYPQLWELDLQSGWKQLPTLNPPSARSPTCIAYDSSRRRLVLFGGLDRQTSQYLSDTWEWDGQTWTQMSPARSPIWRDGAALIHMPLLGGVVLTDGALQGRPLTNETWLWDGSNWTHLNVSEPVVPLPTMVSPNSYVLDTDRQRLFAFFELGQGGVWYLEEESLRASQPLPRPGQPFSLDVSAPRAKGGWVLVAFSESRYPGIGLPAGPGHFGVFPLALDPLLQQSLGFGLVTALDQSGAGSLPFGIPNDARLQGFQFHAAGLLFDASTRMLDPTNAVTIEVVR